MQASLLPLKLLMTPLLIAMVSLVGRRWGPGVGGWLMGFPLTSGPVSVILALQYGRVFAARAAVGTLGGQASVCIFCLTYCIVAQMTNWAVSAVISILSFLVAIFCWNMVNLPLLPTFIVVVLVGTLVLWGIPRRPVSLANSQTPSWDIPARMVIAALFVLGLTTFANTLGPHLSGLISPFPVFGVIIAVFTHNQQGPVAASQLLRGVVMGSFAFSCFFLAVGALLPTASIVLTFVAATGAALVVNSIAYRFLRQKEPLSAGAL